MTWGTAKLWKVLLPSQSVDLASTLPVRRSAFKPSAFTYVTVRISHVYHINEETYAEQPFQLLSSCNLGARRLDMGNSGYVLCPCDSPIPFTTFLACI